MFVVQAIIGGKPFLIIIYDLLVCYDTELNHVGIAETFSEGK